MSHCKSFDIKFSVSFFLSKATWGETLPWSLIGMKPKEYYRNVIQFLQLSLKAPENLTKNYTYLTYTSIFMNEEISSRHQLSI